MSYKEEERIRYLNLDKKRNRQNTFPISYNCGGFALNTFNWYRPYDGDFDDRVEYLFQEAEEILDDVQFAEEIEEHLDSLVLREDVEFMLEEFEGKLRIWNREKLQIGERLIAYKVSTEVEMYKNKKKIYEIDCDFHYRFTDDGETWYEKMGGDLIRECDDATKEKIDDFWETEAWLYKSPTVFFVLKLDQE